MRAIIRRMHCNPAGILSILGIGIFDCPIPEKILRIVLGCIVSRGRAIAIASCMAAILLIGSCAQLARAQVLYSPEELDELVAPIALYPDTLLAQILTAATYPDQIPDAAAWADEHHYLTGDELARAIEADHLPWDPSVQALLPFPSVLEMMASDMQWTIKLGNAFLAQRQDVMDAVQRMRQKAKDYGYLRRNEQIIVRGGPYIEIL